MAGLSLFVAAAGAGAQLRAPHVYGAGYTVRLTVSNAEFSNTAMIAKAVRVYAGADADVDGDGLSDRAEADDYGTDPTDADTDADGMDDGWEVAFEFDPLSATDALEDADVDGVTNFDEYRLRSDPLDPQSPMRVFHVSPDGDDGNDGSLEWPWQTISHALTAVADMGIPVTVRLAVGLYEEDLTLPPWVLLTGDIKAGEVIVSGYITGSASSALKDLTILDPAQRVAYPLLTINGAMQVAGVAFEGGAGSAADGMVVNTGGRRDSLIERCEFSGLKNGIIINGAIPLIRRCWFHHLSGSAIIVSALFAPDKQDDGTLSTETDPNSGYNTIDLASIEGDPAVLNERDEPLIMENNDWGTDDAITIGEGVSEGTDYVPFLKSGSAVGAATANCNVWDAATLEPVTNAAITLSPGSFLPLTENTGGVYTFACLAPDQYTFSVNAPGYNIALKTHTLAAGDNVMLLFPLTSHANEGEGEGEGGGCFGGVADRLQGPPQPGNYGGDFAILLAVVAALAAIRKKAHPKREGIW